MAAEAGTPKGPGLCGTKKRQWMWLILGCVGMLLYSAIVVGIVVLCMWLVLRKLGDSVSDEE